MLQNFVRPAKSTKKHPKLKCTRKFLRLQHNTGGHTNALEALGIVCCRGKTSSTFFESYDLSPDPNPNLSTLGTPQVFASDLITSALPEVCSEAVFRTHSVIFFPKLCLILKNRYLVRLSSNDQERLLMPSS